MFLIDPLLKIGAIEKYVQEHLSQTRQKWRKMWKIGGEMARHEDCLVDAWGKLIKYWKSPMAEHERVDAMNSCNGEQPLEAWANWRLS